MKKSTKVWLVINVAVFVFLAFVLVLRTYENRKKQKALAEEAKVQNEITKKLEKPNAKIDSVIDLLPVDSIELRYRKAVDKHRPQR